MLLLPLLSDAQPPDNHIILRHDERDRVNALTEAYTRMWKEAAKGSSGALNGAVRLVVYWCPTLHEMQAKHV